MDHVFELSLTKATAKIIMQKNAAAPNRGWPEEYQGLARSFGAGIALDHGGRIQIGNAISWIIFRQRDVIMAVAEKWFQSAAVCPQRRLRASP
jgi:hypothetical protein